MFVFVLLSYLVVIPLTWATLRVLRVPEHLELIAGGLLTFSYGVLGTALFAGLV
ncbi:MAG: hypothetical protein ACRDHY_03165 [Anaerolineales bacterium]